MERLNRNELFKIALLLDLPELLTFCSSSSRINKLLCQKDDIWLYKLNQEFPNYKNIPSLQKEKELWYEQKQKREEKGGNFYKDLYLDMKKYSLPKEVDRDKDYYIVDLYKAVEKGYNSKEEFEEFVRSVYMPNLIISIDVLDEKEYKTDLLGYARDVYDDSEGRPFPIYFSYTETKVKNGPYYKWNGEADTDKFLLWSK